MNMSNRRKTKCNKDIAGMPMVVSELKLSDIHKMYDKNFCTSSTCYVNLIEVNSVDSIVKEEQVRVASIDNRMIINTFEKDGRLLLYKNNDSNEPNTVRALEVICEVMPGIYKCNMVKFRYVYSREYGKRIEYLHS